MMGKLKSYQQQVQQILEKGINTAEQRHKRLVTRPFDFAEKVEKEAKNYSFKSVRQAHNHYAKEVYSSLRSLNERASSAASDLISRLEKDAPKTAKADSSDSVQRTDSVQGSDNAQKTAAKKSSTRKPATAKKAASNGQQASAESSTASA